MSIDEYRNIDKDFDLEIFLSNVANMFIKYYSAISLNKLDTVKHFVNDYLYNKALEEINSNKVNNVTHMYDMLNVMESNILSIDEVNDCYVIKVKLIARYLDYYVNSNGSISGNDKDRVTIPYLIELTKNKDSKEINTIKKCPKCGASLLINDSGKCSYCGSTYNLFDRNYIITKIERS